MADPQPPTVVEGATTGDVDDEIPVAAKSAEDRKAAAALSSLDAPRDDESKPAKDVDQEAVRKAMDRLAGTGASNGTLVKKNDEKKAIKKIVKVDPADVTLLVSSWAEFCNGQESIGLGFLGFISMAELLWISCCLPLPFVVVDHAHLFRLHACTFGYECYEMNVGQKHANINRPSRLKS